MLLKERYCERASECVRSCLDLDPLGDLGEGAELGLICVDGRLQLGQIAPGRWRATGTLSRTSRGTSTPKTGREHGDVPETEILSRP